MQQPLLNVWIVVSDHLQIASEHRMVRRVESDNGNVPTRRVSKIVLVFPSNPDEQTI
jgi:hypothetical protein